MPDAPSTAEKRPPLSKRWTFIILALTLLFVLMPFLFWRATWFGRPLSDAQLADVLQPKSNPHDIQHGLSQVSDRIVAHDPAVKRFYPQVIALSSNSEAPIRTMAAWTMGQDNQSPEFHAALLPMLNDSDLTVRRNAALALVRFDDTSGHDIIVAMLKAAAVDAPASGILQTRLKPNQTMNPGTLIARIRTPDGEREVRSEISGTLARWVVSDGATVAAGAHLAAVWPTDDEAWEALRALYLIGEPADLDVIAPYARGGENAPPQLAQQARLTMQAIRSRLPRGTKGASATPTTGSSSIGQDPAQSAQVKNVALQSRKTKGIIYTNRKYRFRFSLPSSWKGYSIVVADWKGDSYSSSGEGMPSPVTGPMISIVHPLSTKSNPRQDIPIMIFTRAQWDLVEQGKLIVSAAPVGPSELGRNAKYVFALPARFLDATPVGWQEVEEIISSDPLQTF